MTQGWPFPGDAPVVRARKVALAYRSVAQEQQQTIADMQALLAKIDRRLLGFTDAALDQAIHAIVNATPVDLVGDLDRRFADWGQAWHAEVVQEHELDDMVPAKVAASLVHLSYGALQRARVRGRIKGEYRGTIEGYWYRVRDVYALSSESRKRKHKGDVSKSDPTVTVATSRRSAAK